MAKKYIVTVNGVSYEVVVEDADPNAVYNAAPAEEKRSPARDAAQPRTGNRVRRPEPGRGTVPEEEIARGGAF